MVEGLTHIRHSKNVRISLRSSVGKGPAHRGVEQWQLVGLITRRSGVRIPPPLPTSDTEEAPQGAFFVGQPVPGGGGSPPV